MNQQNNFLILILFIYFTGCNTQPKDCKHIKNLNLKQTSHIENIQIDSIQLKKEETLDEFLIRAKEKAKSKNEEDLKSIINFPLVGYADAYKKNYETIADLKDDGRIYSFFKESLPLAINIKKDDELGNNWYSVKYRFPQGKNDYYNYYKIDKINGSIKIVGVYIPDY